MARPLSRRSTVVVFVGTTVAVAAILISFAWPGFWPSGGLASTGPTEVVNGRTYCYATVPVPDSSVNWRANYTEWGFTFHLSAPATPGFQLLSVTVTYPNGTAYEGNMSIGGPAPSNFTSMWFAPDNESGMTSVWNSWIVSLLVER